MTTQELKIGDNQDLIKQIPDNYIDCCITSPPYYKMRYYNTTPLIYGGKKDCEHEWNNLIAKGVGGGSNDEFTKKKGVDGFQRVQDTNYALCNKCNAYKGELGWEPTPEMFIQHLVEIFELIRPKIKNIGSLWVNLGDKWIDRDLQLIPEQFALEMKKKKWILINKITWVKPNSMPESVRRRLSKTSELIFHFVKDYNYYYDLDLIREKHKTCSLERYDRALKLGQFSVNGKDYNRNLIGYPKHPPKTYRNRNNDGQIGNDMSITFGYDLKGKNPGDTWNISTQAYSEAHFASFPLELICKPILVTCPINGMVLDPFCGSGTVLEFCRMNNRNAIGFELNPEYGKLIEKRAKLAEPKITKIFINEDV